MRTHGDPRPPKLFAASRPSTTPRPLTSAPSVIVGHTVPSIIAEHLKKIYGEMTEDQKVDLILEAWRKKHIG